MQRRSISVSCALACVLGWAPGSDGGPTSSSNAPPRADSPGDFGGSFQKIIKRVLGRDWKHASCGLRVIDVPTGRVLNEEYVNGNKRIFAASSIKTLLAMAVLRRLERIRALSPADT